MQTKWLYSVKPFQLLGALLISALTFTAVANAQEATDPWASNPDVSGQGSSFQGGGESAMMSASSSMMTGSHTVSCTGGATSTNPAYDIVATLSIFVGGSMVASNSAQGYSPTVYTVASVPYAETYRSVSCELTAGSAFAQGTGQILPVCGQDENDPRTTMIREYRAHGVSLSPQCSDFASSGGSANFSWNELNGGFSNGNPHNPWGMVQAGLTTGLEATRTSYNRGGITLTSGYRCPHGNSAVGGAAQSYHMHGRAADMYSASHAWTETEFNLLKAAADANGPSESLFWHTYADRHYHAAW